MRPQMWTGKPDDLHLYRASPFGQAIFDSRPNVGSHQET